MQYINNKNENYEKIKFNLKIHSKDRNLQLQKNPFNFKINFNPYTYGSHKNVIIEKDINNIVIKKTYGPTSYHNYSIASKFENVQCIKIKEVVLPSKIYTDKYGTHVKNVSLIRLTDYTARIFIDIDQKYEIEENIMKFELGKQQLTISNIGLNNVIMIDKKPYYIKTINTDEIIHFYNKLPNFVKTDLYIPTFNKANNIKINTITKKIEDNYINKIISKNDILYNDSNAIIINSIKDDNINFSFLYETTPTIISGFEEFYLMERNYFNPNEEKCFFVKFKEFKQIKDTSSDINLNESIGIFYVSANYDSLNSSVIVGDGELLFSNNDLKNLSTLSFSLLDSNGNELGEIYNDFSDHRIQNNFHNIIFNLEITVLKEKFN